MNPDYIFVYGTLKKGYRANYMIEKIARYVDKAKIHGIMYNLGSYPGILENSNSFVYGEIYEIKDLDTLKEIDRYEGCDPNDPDSLFVRKRTIAFCDDESQILAFVYFYNRVVEGSPEIHSGIWNKK